MPNFSANARAVTCAPAAIAFGAGTRWSSTTTMRSGSRTLMMSRQFAGMKLLSKRITVSTSTVTMSPGRTTSWPPLAARIFSAMVIPMSAARVTFFQLVQDVDSHEIVDLLERHRKVGPVDGLVRFEHVGLENVERVHHASERRRGEQARIADLRDAELLQLGRRDERRRLPGAD